MYKWDQPRNVNLAAKSDNISVLRKGAPILDDFSHSGCKNYAIIDFAEILEILILHKIDENQNCYIET